MTLAFTCFLGLLAALLAWRQRRRSAGALAGLAVALLLAVGCGPVPARMLAGLQRGLPAGFDDWGARNVIVLLGAGTVRAPAGAEPGLFAQGRIAAAARLWHACRAQAGRVCRIEISGGDALGNGDSEAAVYRRALLGLGVDAADLLL